LILAAKQTNLIGESRAAQFRIDYAAERTVADQGDLEIDASIAHELQKLVSRYLQVVRLHDGLINLLDQHLPPDIFSEK